MLKRGQVTIFIIVGILMLFLTAGLLFLVKNIASEQQKTEKEIISDGSDFDRLQTFVNHCLEKTTKEAMIYVGYRGGYYKVPEPARDEIFFKIPYYYNLGQKQVPSKELIEEQAGRYIEDKIGVCFNNFTSFSSQGFLFIKQMTVSLKKANVQFGNNVIVDFDFPLQVQKGGSLKEFKQFQSVIPLNFEEIYRIINETVAEQEKNNNFVPIGELAASSQENNFTFDLSYLENDVVVYSYLFDQIKIDGEKYAFLFANRYNWSDLQSPESLNYTQDIRSLRCYVGDRCEYNLNIYQDPYTFEDFTSLFDISTDGRISFIPQEKDVGNHSVIVKITDTQSHEDFLTMPLEIVSFFVKPKIVPIPDQLAVVNHNFSYSVLLVEPIKDVIFSDDSDLFDIFPNGTISFTPNESSVGVHSIQITALNNNLRDDQWLYLVVENEK